LPNLGNKCPCGGTAGLIGGKGGREREEASWFGEQEVSSPIGVVGRD